PSLSLTCLSLKVILTQPSSYSSLSLSLLFLALLKSVLFNRRHFSLALSLSFFLIYLSCLYSLLLNLCDYSFVLFSLSLAVWIHFPHSLLLALSFSCVSVGVLCVWCVCCLLCVCVCVCLRYCICTEGGEPNSG